MTSVYAISLLTLLIKIELNIIGAYMFLSNSDYSKTSENNEWSAEFMQQQNGLSSIVQQKYLDNIEKFVNTGLSQLMAMIESHCDEVLRDVSLKESLSVEFLTRKIKLIQTRIEDELFDLKNQESDEFKVNFFTKHVLSGFNVS
jgi:peroxin-3